MPSHTLNIQVAVVYSGSELTEEEKQTAADAAAESAKEAVAADGKGVLSTEGVLEGG